MDDPSGRERAPPPQDNRYVGRDPLLGVGIGIVCPLSHGWCLGMCVLGGTEGAIPLNYAVMRNSMATASLLLEQDGIEQLESVDVNNVTVVDSANSVVMKSFLTDKLRELKEPKQSPGSHQIQGRRSTSHSILMPPTNFLRQTPVFPEA